MFQRASRSIVPDQILDRKHKVWFPTPERDWLLAQRSFVERVLSGDTTRRFGGLRVNGLVQESENTIQGHHKLDTRVWRWLNLILWAEKFSATTA